MDVRGLAGHGNDGAECRRLLMGADGEDVTVDEDVHDPVGSGELHGHHTSPCAPGAGIVDGEVFRADAQPGAVLFRVDAVAPERGPARVCWAAHQVDEIHRRCAEEASDEARGRASVELLGGANLLDLAVVDDRDAVGGGHRIGLVVGDVHDRGTGGLELLADLDPQGEPQLGVQAGHRLVEQDYASLPREGAGQRDPLALTTGHRAWLPIE